MNTLKTARKEVMEHKNIVSLTSNPKKLNTQLWRTPSKVQGFHWRRMHKKTSYS
jgi:hypothetical protein